MNGRLARGFVTLALGRRSGGRVECPAGAWLSWRWIMLTGTPSRASSTACAWRSWCGAKRRRIPAWAASRRNSTAHVGARPGPPAGRAVDDAEQRPDRELDAGGEPRAQLLPAPGVHADLAAAAALAVAHEQRPAPRVEVALAERERLLDAQPAAPEHDDQCAEPGSRGGRRRPARITAMISSTVGGSAGIAQSLVARRAPGVVAGHGRRRAPPTGGSRALRETVMGSSSQSHSGQSPLPYQRSHIHAGFTSEITARFARALASIPAPVSWMLGASSRAKVGSPWTSTPASGRPSTGGWRVPCLPGYRSRYRFAPQRHRRAKERCAPSSFSTPPWCGHSWPTSRRRSRRPRRRRRRAS